MIYVGIDIGSTCAKTAVMNENKEIKDTFVIPTGWSSLEAVERINETLSSRGVNRMKQPVFPPVTGAKP